MKLIVFVFIVFSIYCKKDVEETCTKCAICESDLKCGVNYHTNVCFLANFAYSPDIDIFQHTMDCLIGTYQDEINSNKACNGALFKMDYNDYFDIFSNYAKDIKQNYVFNGKLVLDSLEISKRLKFNVKESQMNNVREQLGKQFRYFSERLKNEIKEKESNEMKSYIEITSEGKKIREEFKDWRPSFGVVFVIERKDLDFTLCTFDYIPKEDPVKRSMRASRAFKSVFRKYIAKLFNNWPFKSVFNGVDEFIVSIQRKENQDKTTTSTFSVEDIILLGEVIMSKEERMIMHVAAADRIVQSASQYKLWRKYAGEVINGNYFSSIRSKITCEISEKITTNYIFADRAEKKVVGAYFDLDTSVMLVLRALEAAGVIEKRCYVPPDEQGDDEVCEIWVKIGFDGRRFADKIMNLFASFQHLNVFSNAQIFKLFKSGMKNVKKENTETMRKFLEEIKLDDAWKHLNGKEIELGPLREKYRIRLFLSCDMKDMHIIMGVGNPLSIKTDQGCWVCGLEDTDPLFNFPVEELEQRYIDNEKKLLKSVEFFSVIIDPLHIVMNMMRVVVSTLFNWSRQLDDEDLIESTWEDVCENVESKSCIKKSRKKRKKTSAKIQRPPRGKNEVRFLKLLNYALFLAERTDDKPGTVSIDINTVPIRYQPYWDDELGMWVFPPIKASDSHQICKFMPVLMNVFSDFVSEPIIYPTSLKEFIEGYVEKEKDNNFILDKILEDPVTHIEAFPPGERENIKNAGNPVKAAKTYKKEVRFMYFGEPHKQLGEYFSRFCITCRMSKPSDEQINAFERIGKGILIMWRELFLHSSITPSFHQGVQHLYYLLERWRTLGLFSQEGCESSNKRHKAIWSISYGRLSGRGGVSTRISIFMDYIKRHIYFLIKGLWGDVIESFGPNQSPFEGDYHAQTLFELTEEQLREVAEIGGVVLPKGNHGKEKLVNCIINHLEELDLDWETFWNPNVVGKVNQFALEKINKKKEKDVNK